MDVASTHTWDRLSPLGDGELYSANTGVQVLTGWGRVSCPNHVLEIQMVMSNHPYTQVHMSEACATIKGHHLPLSVPMQYRVGQPSV